MGVLSINNWDKIAIQALGKSCEIHMSRFQTHIILGGFRVPQFPATL